MEFTFLKQDRILSSFKVLFLKEAELASFDEVPGV